MTTKTKKADAKGESTELVVLTPEEQAYVASVNSTNAQTNSITQPNKLVVNVKSKDADGVKRTIGAWHITNTDKYFDGAIKFRPIRYANKLIRYTQDDAKNWQMAGESIYFKDFGEQIIDSLGGIALGRVFGRSYTDEQKAEVRKNAEVYLDIFGLVQMGDEEWHPVLYRVRGSKIMKMHNAFKAIPKDKIFSEYAYIIETSQPDGKQYWDIEVKPDLSQKLRISDIIAFDRDINTFITESNRIVHNLHIKRANSDIGQRFMAASNNAKDVTDILLDDELPF